jgi:hypothetical protein
MFPDGSRKIIVAPREDRQITHEMQTNEVSDQPIRHNKRAASSVDGIDLESELLRLLRENEELKNRLSESRGEVSCLLLFMSSVFEGLIFP